MLYAAKALAMTMVDLYTKPELVQAIKKEFKERKGDVEYKAILPDAPPPIEMAKQEAAARGGH